MKKIDFKKLSYEERCRIRDKASELFDREFNQLSFSNYKKIVGEGNEIDLVLRPSDEILVDEYLNEIADEDVNKMKDDFEDAYKSNPAVENNYSDDEKGFKEFVIDNYQDEMNDCWSDKEWYPAWGTVFEAKNNFMSNFLVENVDKLYDIGIGVLESTDDLNACMFIAGAGYNFYDAHWIPLFTEVLKWITPKTNE